MPALAALNGLLAFLVEIAALAAIAAGAHSLAGQPALRWVAPAAAVVAVAALWGRYAAPKSRRRLHGAGLVAFKTGVFAAAAMSLWPVTGPFWAAAYASAAAIQIVLAIAVGSL
ncbi:MAG: hypothetical protein Kow0026_06710 [Oricola sp.]